MTKARILLAGAGLIGRKHLELALGNPACTLVGLVDPAPVSAACAVQHGIAHFTDLESALEDVRPDGVIIATPNALHVEQGLACIRRGIPVLVEKPIAETMEGAAHLVGEAERSDVPILVGHHRRHSAVLTQARRILQSGRLGKITAIMGTTLLRKPEHYFETAPWRKMKGAGPILVNLIHDMDNLRYLCGEIVSVQACASNAARGFAVEDTAAITMRFANGALGTYLLSDIAAAPRSWDQTSSERNSFHQYSDGECYLIAGDRGSLTIPALRLAEYNDARDWALPMQFSTETAEPDDAHEMQFAHFLEVIARRALPLVSGRDAMRTLGVTLAIARAAETGVPVAC